MQTVVKCNHCGCENTMEGLYSRRMLCWMCKKEVNIMTKCKAKHETIDFLSKVQVQSFIDKTDIMSGWKLRYHEEAGGNWTSIGFPFSMNTYAEFCKYTDKWTNHLKEHEVNGYYCESCDSIFQISPSPKDDGICRENTGHLPDENCPYCDVPLIICEKVSEDE